MGSAWDYVPGVSNIKGAVTGNWGEAATGPANALLGGAPNDLLAPKKPDISASTGANQRSQSLAQSLDAQRQNYQPMGAPQIGPQPPPAPASPAPPAPGTAGGLNIGGALAPVSTSISGHVAPPMPPLAPAPASVATTQGPDMTRQQGALDLLQGAATGDAPSAAQLQLQQQSSKDIANQYGLATALQGRTPGGALRAAEMGAASVQGQTNADAAQLRANEMATARTGYATATTGARGQDIQTDVANLNAKLTTMGYDVQTKNALLSAQLQAMGYDAQTADAVIAAQVSSANSANQFKGGLISTTGNLLAMSDEREKTDVEDADMGAFLEALHPKLFKYKDASNGPGQRVGIMAQDAAKSKVGRSFVVGGGDEPMMLDVGNGLGAALAASAELHKRVKALESR